MKRLGEILLYIVFALPILFTGAWSAATLYYHPPFGAPQALGVAIMAALTLAALLFGWRSRTALFLYVFAFIGVVFFSASLKPDMTGEFRTELSRPPYAKINGDVIEIANIRNFVWRSEEKEDYDARWETRSYSLDKIKSLDLINTYWDAGPGIAHTIFSFGFEDGRHLAFSIEVRRKKGQTYDTVSGFFQNFELIYIAADEHDVIGLRHIRPEDSYVYRLNTSPEHARALFREYVTHLNALVDAPRFYNTITHNCATEVFEMARAAGLKTSLDWRMILNGYLPDLAYRDGHLNTKYPLAELRKLGQTQPRYRDTLDSVAFSAMLRDGVPGPNDAPPAK